MSEQTIVFIIIIIEHSVADLRIRMPVGVNKVELNV